MTKYKLDEDGRVTLHPAHFRQLLAEPDKAHELIDLSHYPHTFKARTSFQGNVSIYYTFEESSLGHNDNGLYEFLPELVKCQ